MEKTILFERNIAQLMGPTMYSFADYFFSNGKKTHLQYLAWKVNLIKFFLLVLFFLIQSKLTRK